ncbi:MAG: VCBS repeat-containing protein, partial [Acidobacteria bacterium]|nr:VCBS repeat-containing protein [Acidobacteriota bacterium]
EERLAKTTLPILVGEEDGSFTHAPDLVDGTIDARVPIVVADDFNGDGRPDLAVFDGGYVFHLSGRVKTGHLWTPQNRPFPAPETGVDLYFRAPCVRKVVWTLVRQLRGPHFSTCA